MADQILIDGTPISPYYSSKTGVQIDKAVDLAGRKEDLHTNAKTTLPAAINELKYRIDQGLDEEAIEEQAQLAIRAWLDEHPEATTTVQDGSLMESKFSKELKLSTIKDYVTPQMFGAKADGATDDTDAIQDAIDSGMNVFFPAGTYRLLSTINISTKVKLIGMGVLSTINYAGTDYCLNISTSYTNFAEIENLHFVGTDSNNMLKCYRGRWGSSVQILNCYIENFNLIFDIYSAFGASFKNILINSNGKIRFKPYDDSATLGSSFSNDILFENVYFGGKTKTSSACLFELNNVINALFKICALEHTQLVFSTQNCDKIHATNCWFEDVTAIQSGSSVDVEQPNVVGVDKLKSTDTVITKWIKNINHTFFKYLGGVSQTPLSVLFQDGISETTYGSIDIYNPQVDVYQNVKRNTLISEMSKIPRNIKKGFAENAKECTVNLYQFGLKTNVSAIFDVTVLIRYPDTSYAIHEKRFIQSRLDRIDGGEIKPFYVDDWGTSQQDTININITDYNMVLTTTRTFTYAFIIVKFEPLGAILNQSGYLN